MKRAMAPMGALLRLFGKVPALPCGHSQSPPLPWRLRRFDGLRVNK